MIRLGNLLKLANNNVLWKGSSAISHRVENQNTS